MKNIVLLGFMGTGKTTVAKKIAALSGMIYVSTDDVIEDREGMAIAVIFEKKGEKYFRAVEKEVISEISLRDKVVIDAGGGVVLDRDNMQSLGKKGVLVCLWADPEDIYKRTKKYATRPLLNVKDPLAAIKRLMDKRKACYEAAGYHVNTSAVGADEAAETIIGFAKRHG
ncbi:MAG: shikimate kinase [Candidatus Omnitrophota bacterium]